MQVLKTQKFYMAIITEKLKKKKKISEEKYLQ
jgi:hypothetical protein